jgi:hypothetical protein
MTHQLLDDQKACHAKTVDENLTNPMLLEVRQTNCLRSSPAQQEDWKNDKMVREKRALAIQQVGAPIDHYDFPRPCCPPHMTSESKAMKRDSAVPPPRVRVKRGESTGPKLTTSNLIDIDVYRLEALLEALSVSE